MTFYSDSQRQSRVHQAAMECYSGVLPLSKFDQDHFCISISVAEEVVCFTVGIIDAATSGDDHARRIVDRELELRWRNPTD